MNKQELTERLSLAIIERERLYARRDAMLMSHDAVLGHPDYEALKRRIGAQIMEIGRLKDAIQVAEGA